VKPSGDAGHRADRRIEQVAIHAAEVVPDDAFGTVGGAAVEKQHGEAAVGELQGILRIDGKPGFGGFRGGDEHLLEHRQPRRGRKIAQGFGGGVADVVFGIIEQAGKNGRGGGVRDPAQGIAGAGPGMGGESGIGGDRLQLLALGGGNPACFQLDGGLAADLRRPVPGIRYQLGGGPAWQMVIVRPRPHRPRRRRSASGPGRGRAR
jgi:hypothetical protein